MRPYMVTGEGDPDCRPGLEGGPSIRHFREAWTPAIIPGWSLSNSINLRMALAAPFVERKRGNPQSMHSFWILRDCIHEVSLAMKWMTVATGRCDSLAATTSGPPPVVSCHS